MVDLNVSPPQGLETSYGEVTVHTVCVSLSVPRGKEKSYTRGRAARITDRFETKIIRAPAEQVPRQVPRVLLLSLSGQSSTSAEDATESIVHFENDDTTL